MDGEKFNAGNVKGTPEEFARHAMVRAFLDVSVATVRET
jgi:hypothetical protein